MFLVLKDAQEEELRDAFKECGDIENIRIVRDRQLGSGKGFGYVNFKVIFAFDN